MAHVGTTQPCSRLELSFSCQDLRDADWLSKSDPVVHVYEQINNSEWTLLGKTEIVQNNLNPKFTTQINVDFYFEVRQQLRVEVLDVDDPATGTGDSLGSVTVTLSQIVGSFGNCYSGQLQGKGRISIYAEECSNTKGCMVFNFAGENLANKDGWFSKSDPFLVISKSREDGKWIECAKTEVVKNNLNPVWKPLEVDLNRLCQGDFQRPLLINVRDWDADDKYEDIGYVQTNAAALQNPETLRLKLLHPRGKKKDVGTVRLTRPTELRILPTFLDYLHGGTEISASFAIDFTASNGDPRAPDSLHFNSSDPNHINFYEHAICSIGGIIAPYDHDQMFPAYGFGGMLPNKTVSHCFTLAGGETYVHGVNGVMTAYNQALVNVKLHGPTLFNQVINTVAQEARHAQQTSACGKYILLLIITDGVIMDMQDTMDAIVAAADLPMSIVIVGVGSADFSEMQRLDGDDERLQASNGAYACRDIVQFVEMNSYQGPSSGALLAKDVLAELPGQMVEYYTKKGIPPNPPVAVPHASPFPTERQPPAV